MDGGPVVGRVLRLLRGLLVQVVHGAEGVHGVQRVAVHPVMLHAERVATCTQEEEEEKERRARVVRNSPMSGAHDFYASARSLSPL